MSSQKHTLSLWKTQTSNILLSKLLSCSEIHAWVANKVSNLGQWENVALFPFSDFIAKNWLAREDSQSVSPVTIPAVITIVDRQFKEDRTLCPVWSLRYYLDWTKNLRGSQSLLFISFKKGRTSDIRPATLSSWLKQTILLCYKQADQQALDLVQVKAHDIRAFAASKAFLKWGIGGPDYANVSLESSQHVYQLLLKRPYLVRQRQQYVSGTSSSSTTSPRPFPSASLSSGRKEGGMPESFPGSRYQSPFMMFTVRSFYPLIMYSLIQCTLISFSEANVMKFRPRVCILAVVPLRAIPEWARLHSLLSEHPDSIRTVITFFWFLATYRPDHYNRGSVIGTQTGNLDQFWVFFDILNFKEK